jgi:hypothetical protein
MEGGRLKSFVPSFAEASEDTTNFSGEQEKVLIKSYLLLICRFKKIIISLVS